MVVNEVGVIFTAIALVYSILGFSLMIGVPWPRALLYAVSPALALAALGGGSLLVDKATFYLALRQAAKKRLYTLRAFTEVGNEVWVTWLPGVRCVAGDRKIGEAFLADPMFGLFCWRDESSPDEWAELEELISEECRRENQGRVRVAALKGSDLAEKLTRLGYSRMDIDDFKRAVEDWCNFMACRSELRDRQVMKRNKRG